MYKHLIMNKFGVKFFDKKEQKFDDLIKFE